MTRLPRRALIALPLLFWGAAPTRAAVSGYRGWTLDDGLMKGGIPDDILSSLKAQIDLVESIEMKPEIKAAFRDQTLILDPTLKQPGKAGPRKLFLKPEIMPAENPVLLHELLHVYHFTRLPDGRNNATVRRFYNEAKARSLYPPQSYMMTNPAEFFAMTASVVLWGQAARPPFERETVKTRQPELYAWITSEFALKTAD